MARISWEMEIEMDTPEKRYAVLKWLLETGTAEENEALRIEIEKEIERRKPRIVK